MLVQSLGLHIHRPHQLQRLPWRPYQKTTQRKSSSEGYQRGNWLAYGCSVHHRRYWSAVRSTARVLLLMETHLMHTQQVQIDVLHQPEHCLFLFTFANKCILLYSHSKPQLGTYRCTFNLWQHRINIPFLNVFKSPF